MRGSLAPVIAPLVVALSLSGSILSQSSTGSISGTIVDENDAVIPRATVTGRNTATGFVRSVTTDSNGRYRLADIPTGTYKLTIDAPNFKRIIRGDITLARYIHHCRLLHHGSIR